MTNLPQPAIIGYRKNGAPIWQVMGGSMPTNEPVQPQGQPQGQPPVTINVPPNQPPAGQYFTAEQLEAARQQEKDKLYDRMQKLEAQFTESKATLDTYRQEREAAEQARKAAEDAAAEAKKKADEEKLSVQELIAKRENEWKQQQLELQNKMDAQMAIAEKERQLFQLQSYIQRRVSECLSNDEIIPDLVDYINGETEEEVEASITKAKEKTASIVAGATRMNGGGQQTQPPAPGVSPTGLAPTGPLDTYSGQRQYTAEDISKMSVSEYAKFRAQAGIDRAGNNQGLFS